MQLDEVLSRVGLNVEVQLDGFVRQCERLQEGRLCPAGLEDDGPPDQLPPRFLSDARDAGLAVCA
jgi:hypothetical protein